MLSVKYAIVLASENFNGLYNTVTEGLEENERKANEPKSKKVGKIIAGATVGGALAWLFPLPTCAVAGGLLIREGIIRHQGKKIKREWESWGDWAAYSVEDLPQEFVFEEAPEPQSVYFSCNYKPNYYYPVAVFQEKIEEIKKEAISDMLEGLGAKKIMVYDANSEKKAISAGVAATKIKVQGDINYTDGYSEVLEQETEFNEPLEIKASSHPYILDSKLWSKHQERRMRGRIKSDKVVWKLENESCFGASVAEKFSQAGLKIGGDYKAYKSKTFKVVVDYWEIRPSQYN